MVTSFEVVVLLVEGNVGANVVVVCSNDGTVGPIVVVRFEEIVVGLDVVLAKKNSES